MKKHLILFLPLLMLATVACRDSSDVGPDLTTQLVGQYKIQYLVSSWDGLVRQETPTAKAFLILERKNNSTLTVRVKIDDGPVQVNDQMEATVSLADKADDYLFLPNLDSRYKLITTYYTDRNKKQSEGISFLNRYRDGKIRGTLGYSQSTTRIFSIGILP